MRTRISISIVALLILSVFASAQVLERMREKQQDDGSIGKITGRVVDENTGEGLPSVNILVKGTYYGASSDFDGNYKIERVNPGTYNIDVTLLGYKTVQYSGIKIEAGKTIEINVKMSESVLSLGQEVVIIGEKRLFDVEETSSKRSIKTEDITVAAVTNVKDVVGLQTGVVQSDNEIHIRGSRGYENAYLVDGVSVQDVLGGSGFGLQISPEAIQEMEVITGGYNAEYGQATSGVVNITTKEGSDRYSGGISYKTDRIVDVNSRHFFNTDIFEANLSGPFPGADALLPGTVSFFGNISGNVTDGYTRWSENVRQGIPTGKYDKRIPTQLFSTTFNGTDFGFRLSNSYSWSSKVTWKPSPTFKIAYSFNQSVSIDQNSSTVKTSLEREEPQPGYQYLYQNILDSAQTYTQVNLQHTFSLTHTLSPKSYYDIRFSKYTAHVRGDANGKSYQTYQEPKDIVTMPVEYFTYPDSVRIGVIPGDGFYDLGGPTSWRDHFIDDYTLKFDFTNHFSEKNKFKAGVEMKFQDLQMVDISEPWVKPLGTNNDIYQVSPASGAVYAQENISISGMVLNFGLRFDYWFPGKFVDDAIENKSVELASENLREQYTNQTYSFFGRRWKGRISPRLGISHPVSDNQTLFFSYGHFSKLPRPTYVYTKLKPSESSAKAAATTYGNPILNPETTVAYELGLRNQITENDVLTLTAYYKDIFDYITGRSVRTTNPKFRGSYFTYINSDYARTRGFEFDYTHRFSSQFRSTLSGSYSIATGKSSSATEALFNLSSGGIESAIKENFVSWDRPWQVNATSVLNVKKGEPLYDIAPGILDDYTVYMRAFFQSGKRYTQQDSTGVDKEGRIQYTSRADNPLQGIAEYWFYINMNIEKYFDLGFGRLTISLEIQNVLDNKNSQIVNPVTQRDADGKVLPARAYEYGDNIPTSDNDPRFPDREGRISPYPYNPARYLSPRTARLGISLRF